jgi:endonuclease/exonuclease/phosphatase family metal-dependent hydrolase
MIRRLACFAAILTALGSSSADSQPTDSGIRLRVMAANISSGRLQSYPNPGPGVRIFQALRPDVVLIQEFNVNATRGEANDEAAVDAWVDDVFGAEYHWFREPGGDSIPNGVISRWPIVEAGEWRDDSVSNRDFAFARIDLPGEIDLWAVSLHLLTRSAAVRNTEAEALVRALRGHPVPEDDYLVVGGDFNTDRRNEPAVTTLGQIVDILGPFPNDGDNPPDGDTNSRRRKPYDWLLSDGDLQAVSVATEVGDFVFPDGLVFDTRTFTTEELEEDFPPALRDDSDARQMQHMAVVRDFEIGSAPHPPDDDFTVSSTAVGFGTAEADSEPLTDSSIEILVSTPFSLTAMAFTGSHPGEFVLADPDLGAGPVRIEGDTSLTFVWTPGVDDGQPRRVTATLITDGEPGAFEVELSGALRSPGESTALDLGGYRLEQTGGEATLTVPPGTVLEPGGFLIVGRAADRAEFEAFWGALDPAVVYLNGTGLVGEPGFPVINGGEGYRLLDAEGSAVDPATGLLPIDQDTRGRALEREATDRAELTSWDDPIRDATPGAYGGEVRGTGRLVITEIADAPGSGSFIFEFVELFYDAALSPP